MDGSPRFFVEVKDNTCGKNGYVNENKKQPKPASIFEKKIL
jgi:hypothetical protein